MLKIIAQSSGDLIIEIYDVIGFFGTNSRDFANRLKQAKGKDVTLRINSPGGSVMEGTVIYNLLKAHDGKVTAIVDGMAASMAGVIAMAAEHVVMPSNSFFMIHKPQILDGGGNADELRNDAAMLDKMEANLVAAYMAKTGKSKATVQSWFEGSSENWFSAAECLKMGIADEVTDALDAAACTKFAAYFPDKQFAAEAATLPSAIPAGGHQEQPTMKQIIAVLGLLATATEAEVAAEAQKAKDRVATLERENGNLVTAHTKALRETKDAALQEATNAVTTAEKKRRTDIKAHADKYNKDGDLNEAVVAALSGDTTLEAFKDTVTDLLHKRPTKGAIRPQNEGGGGGEADPVEVKDVESFVVAYKACKSDVECRQLVRKHRAFARQAAKAGSISE